jgi:hypothetical protein
MKIHIRIFHHITSIGLPSISGLVFVVIIYLHPHTSKQAYKAFLENNMRDFLANVPLIIRQELCFMRDGAPAHFSLVARRYLNRKFPGHR